MNQLSRFAICTQNINADDLELRKVYLIIPDTRAENENLLRIVDESGEDYLYPANYFVAIDLPQEDQQALLMAA